jgi:GNAT superfamily N-acetyltransferase
MHNPRTTSGPPALTRHSPASLTAEERAGIERFVTAFIAYPKAKLHAVLDSADYVWLCHDPDGRLVGTTAVRRVQVQVGSEEVRVIYTYMVAIDPAYRRVNLTAKMGVRTFLIERLSAPRRALYWLALAASPAGYLQMARNFPTCWPRPGASFPEAERSVLVQALECLGMDQVESFEGCFRLRDEFGVSDQEQAPHRWAGADAEIDFFLRVNPDYQRGSDLACLCPLGFASVAEGAMRQVLRRIRLPRLTRRTTS